VSDNIGEIALVVMPDSSIRSIKDLAGKKIAITAPKSTTEWMTRMVLDKNGLSGQAQLVPAGGFAPALTALSLHAVDAAPLNDPGLTRNAAKYRVLFAYSDQIPRVTWLVGVTTAQFAAKEPEKLRGIIKAYRRAVDFLYANRAAATSIYAEVWELSPDEANRLLPKYFDMPGEWTHGEFNPEGLQTMSAAEMLIGNTDKPVDWKPIIDQSLLPEDLRRPL
jgi:NitT/TauT family transport system substrate-binding protein